MKFLKNLVKISLLSIASFHFLPIASITSCSNHKDPEPSWDYLEFKDDGENGYSVKFKEKSGDEKELTTLVIPDTYNNKPVSSIAEEGFYYYRATSIIIVRINGNNLKKIGEKAFYECIQLRQVILPWNLEII